MVGTIVPMVHGQRSRIRGLLILGLHGGGYVLGAMMLGAFLGALGAKILLAVTASSRPLVTVGVTAAISLLYGSRELGVVRIPVPQLQWQVPRAWRAALPPELPAALYGMFLGPGLVTRIPVGTFYAVVMWSLMRGSPILGLLAMGVFGLGRTVPLGLLCPMDASAPGRWLVTKLSLWKPSVQLLNGMAVGFAGSSLLGALLVGR